MSPSFIAEHAGQVGAAAGSIGSIQEATMNLLSSVFADDLFHTPCRRALLLNVSEGSFVSDLLGQIESVTILHRNAAVLSSLRQQFGACQGAVIGDAVFPSDEQAYDACVLAVPKGRDLARAMLVTGMKALRAGANFLAFGPNRGGVRMAQTDLSMLGSTETVATKARNRFLKAIRPAVVHAPADWGTPWLRAQRTFVCRGREYAVYTQPGVFSWERLDEGSAFLLDQLPQLQAPAGVSILDAGCGCGILGLVARAELNPASVVWADVDLLAVNCVRATVPDGTVLAADLTRDDLGGHGPFDLILCNPPFHQEHVQDLSFMQAFARRAGRMLKPQGRLVLVANAFLPYPRLLREHFATVLEIANNPRFRVLCCSS